LFLVDKPYISDFFKTSVRDHAIPIIGTAMAEEMGLLPGTEIIPEKDALQIIRDKEGSPLYTTSENALSWIIENLGFSGLPAKVELFKDKMKFRQLTESVAPELFYKSVGYNELCNINPSDLVLPLIIKPATGFMSEGVYKVFEEDEWTRACEKIIEEISQKIDLYPKEVVDTSSFILESCIQGEEFALDVYYDAAGEGVILNILKHRFRSEEDVGDRIYSTSKMVVEEYLEPFTKFAEKIGRLADLKNFPAHVELRKTDQGELIPIEVNPLRFGGWCTTADLAFHAYGYNPYLYYYSQLKPDWPGILHGMDNNQYSIIILDNSTGAPAEKIISFNYDKLLSDFENPLELREFDFREYPLFGFLFTETSEGNEGELDRILASDLREYIITSS
jgi:hypothetical protein